MRGTMRLKEVKRKTLQGTWADHHFKIKQGLSRSLQTNFYTFKFIPGSEAQMNDTKELTLRFSNEYTPIKLRSQKQKIFDIF